MCVKKHGNVVIWTKLYIDSAIANSRHLLQNSKGLCVWPGSVRHG